MRVLAFLTSAGIGGTERMTITLLNALASQATCCLALKSGGPLRSLVDERVEVREMGLSRVRQAVWPLTQTIKEWRPEILLATKPDASIGLAVAWRMSGRRGRLVLRESNHRTAQGIPKRSLLSLILRWAYRHADAVVSPTRSVQADLCNRYGLQPSVVSVIPNPLDCAQAQNARARAGARRPDPQSAAGCRILAIGRLVRQKGFDILLQAIAALPRQDVTLTILGEGPMRDDLARLAARLNLTSRISMPGATPDPFAAMASADLFVLSSRWEGFPNALVEAMAFGLPVVATRCPSGPEEIIEHERSGLLCQSDSPQSLADAIQRLLDDPDLGSRLGIAARSSCERFDAPLIASQYSQLFAWLLTSCEQAHA
jgi:glycosyltransferase involved in cell wall biosynthesis